MTTVVTGDSVVDGWRAASIRLLAARPHRLRNVITEINSPTVSDPLWMRRYDPKSVGAADRLSVVAKILFPAGPFLPNTSRADIYGRWGEVLKRSREAGKLRSAWGSSYFERLVSFDGSENQIEAAIRALSTWRQRKEAAIVAHLSSPHLDGLRTRGSPCLQYLELLWGADGRIDLVAVYRNHDFLNKALGNFIGLGRLLSFITAESGKLPGRLVCHSVHAYCDQSRKLRLLVAR